MDDKHQTEFEELDTRDEIDLIDMLSLFGHRALGLTERESLEIDPMYHYQLEAM